MDNRISFGLGTAAIALLLLPLGYQLYTTTAFSPPPPLVVASPAQPAAADASVARNAAESVAQVETDTLAAPVPQVTAALPAPAGPPSIDNRARTVTLSIQANGRAAQSAPMASYGAGAMEKMIAVPGMPRPPIAEASGDTFESFAESGLKSVAQEPVSTFSIDVDTASYSYVRRALNEGRLPPADAVRVEELINYFPYDYPAPDSAATPFSTTVSVFPTPWNARTQLMHIGINGFAPDEVRKPVNLTFLIDTSGSMDAADKLPLLKRALGLLVDRMTADDTVSIVTYAGSAGVVLEPTKGNEKSKILAALDTLTPGGSTAGAEGIALAYRLAEENRVADGVNRVILATDGDFNVGISDPAELRTYIKSKRDGGVTLSILGFGQGNLDDATMQALAQNGNGKASYIDSLREAQKVLVEEGGGTLPTIAGDVKIQVEFNPATIAEYRLIGYETRALAREDFNNDRVDAGDIEAGHQVTAIYELVPKGSGAESIDPLRYGTQTTPAPTTAVAGENSELAFVKLRYKRPGETESRLVEVPVSPSAVLPSIDAASADMRFAAAVAAFGQRLRNSDFGTMDYAAIRALAQGARGTDEGGYRAEFVSLVGLAESLSR